MTNIAVLLLLLAFTSVGCSSDASKAPSDNQLELISTHPVSVQEPSGLTMDNSNQYLWTVSDQHKKIYKISFEGDNITSFDCDVQDLEGIAHNPADSSLYAVGERRGEIICMATNGDEIDRFIIEPDSADPTSFEGITFNADGSRIYLLNKENPRLLIELDSSFEILNEYPLNFSEDCSGIAYDEDANCLWVLSDRSKSVTKCTVQGIPLINYQLDIKKPEGIALDLQSKHIYIVSDSAEKLYKYQLPE